MSDQSLRLNKSFSHEWGKEESKKKEESRQGERKKLLIQLCVIPSPVCLAISSGKVLQK